MSARANKERKKRKRGKKEEEKKNVLFFPLLFFFLSLLAQADICAAELATWGVGPDVGVVM